MLSRSIIQLSRIQNSNLHLISRLASTTPKIGKEGIEDDTPVKFSTTVASKWRAEATRKGTTQKRLWYEPYVVLASISIFMLYFAVLREENDVDLELGKSLYSRIDGLEEVQLRQSLKYNKEHGLDTKAITERLKELEMIRQRKEKQN